MKIYILVRYAVNSKSVDLKEIYRIAFQDAIAAKGKEDDLNEFIQNRLKEGEHSDYWTIEELEIE